MDATRVCSIDGCERPLQARGWCGTHYERWRQHGDPNVSRGYHRTAEDSFKAKTKRSEDGCLVWTGAVTDKGYGDMKVAGLNARAHRYAWERANGPIPEGMLVDHMCWNHSCVEISHLRLATNKQNLENRRAANAGSTSGVRGVHWYASRRKWSVKVGHNRKSYFVGYFDTIEEAAEAAAAKRAELFTHSQN